MEKFSISFHLQSEESTGFCYFDFISSDAKLSFTSWLFSSLRVLKWAKEMEKNLIDDLNSIFGEKKREKKLPNLIACTLIHLHLRMSILVYGSLFFVPFKLKQLLQLVNDIQLKKV